MPGLIFSRPDANCAAYVARLRIERRIAHGAACKIEPERGRALAHERFRPDQDRPGEVRPA